MSYKAYSESTVEAERGAEAEVEPGGWSEAGSCMKTRNTEETGA